jgi:hypothetical protein
MYSDALERPPSFEIHAHDSLAGRMPDARRFKREGEKPDPFPSRCVVLDVFRSSALRAGEDVVAGIAFLWVPG